MDLENLKFPIGKYKVPEEITEELFEEWVSTLNTLPEELKKRVGNLSYNELELIYRPGGWNIKQVVHHLADSHMNSFVRFKLIITEENPTIRPYTQEKWAKTADAINEDIMDSIAILEGIHKRLVTLLKSLSTEQKQRTFIHPEYNKQLTLIWMVGLYAWHSSHHLAHIEQALEHKGEFTPDKIAQ